MRRRVSVLIATAVAGAAAIYFFFMRQPALHFVTTPVTKQDISRVIIATGAVNPVVTVQVGTYVSGVIQTLSCDFNTTVQAGQRCAKIDPRPYQETVDQAKASVATAEAQRRKDQASLDQAKVIYERDQGLLAQGAVSQESIDEDRSTYEQAVAQVHLDEATIDQRRAALEAAQVNLDYTDIVSPVNGTVVSRAVDVGQTVAASFQTPTLFLIAQDLTQMEVDTNVSETDVGLAQLGQKATFTVEAYPDRTFVGKVRQVRQAPITVQNVVTYNVVISVANPELLLFPGMTANVRILVDERKNVATIPSQALRFDPKGVHAQAQGGSGRGDGNHGDGDGTRVYVLKDGRPQAVKISTGVDDGTRVEVTSGELAVGDPVIVEQKNGARSGETAARSPFRF
jgi:HlyD family secretion protein